MQIPFKYAKPLQIPLTDITESLAPLQGGHLLENKFSPQINYISCLLSYNREGLI